MTELTLIGAPTDVGASVLGASMGPDALRIAGIARALQGLGLAVQDLGNLSGPGNPQAAPQGGFRHLVEVTRWNEAVFAATLSALQAGRLPLLMGGDHCLAIGSISAVARHCSARGRRLKVLWFDAHADANTPASSPSGNLHGMPVACLLGHGPAQLTQLAGAAAALQAQQITLVGVRSVDATEKSFVNTLGIEVYDMRSIDELGMRAVMQAALADVDENTHLHLSFDMDGLDPTIAPGVGTPVRGGPTYRETQLFMEMLADSGALGSVDIMELNPALDLRNQTAELAVDLLESLFGKSTLMRA
ncbi:MAG TPA: arginase [Alicycliphilus sp.]|jgi:arginase|uniref:Arginase n=1 Tax=Diaphorobacter limosus TaxID=3036128 RepID=A0ABZ0J123_9BURK|nr:arginase [Diaphorobacter sp. Y-1]MBP7325202.1 arginase [Alicycliphilus sp.]MCA0440984.1 arginase [Pseudomonadota bacterium]MBP8779104.1 arginase [Alicycliphilus sp.]TXJ07457.1 MAG: arginase [Alicycliphilus sp.]WOO31031.1 arginase [Diaphorobacter sp. Y-1]